MATHRAFAARPGSGDRAETAPFVTAARAPSRESGVQSQCAFAAAGRRLLFASTQSACHPKEPIMFDRLFMPALTFTLLVAAAAAFAGDFAETLQASQIVKLERVIITAQRELPATPLAHADASLAVIVTR